MSILEENWNYEFDIKSNENNNFKEFENEIKKVHEDISNIIENGFKIQKYNCSSNMSQTHEDELRNLIEQNKHLQNEIDVKLMDLSQKKTQYEHYKKDQKLLSQEIKETHEAFLMAKKWYKKFLKVYYTIESRKDTSQVVYLQFFTETKKESENYSVRLFRDTKAGNYRLLGVTPELPMFKELQQRLQDTNDVPGALCCIRSVFLNKKMNKKYKQ